uniref:Uncharacterized protein n=1 Tax=Meloidogyne floridensis TaxID=298350 RepID=A0A915NHU1_9BILA
MEYIRGLLVLYKYGEIAMKKLTSGRNFFRILMAIYGICLSESYIEPKKKGGSSEREDFEKLKIRIDKGIKEIIIEGEESQHGVETLIINGELKTIVINEELKENRVIVVNKEAIELIEFYFKKAGKEIVEKKCVHNFDLNELSKEAKEAKGIVD